MDYNNPKFEIKDENITVIPIFEMGLESPENSRYEKAVIKPRCLNYAKVCQCQYKRMRTREQLKNRIPNSANVPLRVEQSDIDTLRFAVIASGEDGLYKSINLVIVQCSQCGRMQFYGELLPVANIMADAYEAFSAAVKNTSGGERFVKIVAPCEDDEPGLMFENLETGEMTSADSTLKAMVKSATNGKESED